MDHSRCSLPGTVTQAIDNFKTVFSQRVQTLERGGMGKREITSYLLESALSPPPGPGTAELELVRKHGVLDTQSAAQILAIRSELLKLQRQGLDVPTSINEMTKRIRQVEIDTTTRKRKRDPNSDNLEANEAKRTKLSPTERYMERYKKRKAEQDEGPDFVPPAPKRFRFMNYRDPILHVPDPIAFQFQVSPRLNSLTIVGSLCSP